MISSLSLRHKKHKQKVYEKSPNKLEINFPLKIYDAF